MPENRFFGSKEYNVVWPSNPTQALVLAIESAGAALDRERTLDMNDAVANTPHADFRREAGRRKKRWLKKMSAKFSEIINSGMRTRSSALSDEQAPDDADSDHRPKKKSRRLIQKKVPLMTPAARKSAPLGITCGPPTWEDTGIDWRLMTDEEREEEEEDEEEEGEEEEEEGPGECNNR